MDYNRTLRFSYIFAHSQGGGQYGGGFDGYKKTAINVLFMAVNLVAGEGFEPTTFGL